LPNTGSAWRHVSLGDLCAEGGGNIQTGPFGSQLHAADYVPFGIPSVMPLNIGDNVIVEDDIARITEADAKRLQRYRLAEGDIVYSRRGDVEKRALVRSEHDGWLCGTGCLRVRLGDRDRNDSQFISYLLGVPKTREWISQHAIGATMPNLNTGILSSVPLQVPDIEEQRSIVEVLGAFDEKIAANRRLLPLLDLHMALEYTRATSRSGRTVMLADVAAFQNRESAMKDPGTFRTTERVEYSVASMIRFLTNPWCWSAKTARSSKRTELPSSNTSGGRHG
jgi:type I restriction enzyme S subunit